MKLIEKKCPNCGASLEFSESAKSCKCEYCHRTFEIEREEKSDVKDKSEQFNLNELQVPLKTFGFIQIILIVFSLLIVFLMIFGVSQSFNSSNKDFSIIFGGNKDETSKLLTDVDSLDDDQISKIETKTEIDAHQAVNGQSDLNYSYQISDNLRLEKIYIASKDDTNQLVVIFKSSYHNFFNQSDNQTVYTPVVYKNVNDKLNLENGKNTAPEYYFNPEKTSYVYAYKNIDEAYEKILKPLEDDGYTITQN